MLEPFFILGCLVALGVLVLLSIKLSRELFWGLAALVFFLPFERIPTLELGDFTLKINHILGIWLILFYLLKLAFERKKIQPAGLGGLIWLLILALALSFSQTQLPVRSLALFSLDIFVILIFFIFSQLIDSQAKLLKIQKILLITLAVSLIFSGYQFLGDMAGLPNRLTGLDPGYTKQVFGFPRIQGFSREPLYLGNLLLLGVGFMAAIFANKKPFPYFYWYLAGLVLAILLTISRGAVLGLLLFLMMWGLTNLKHILTPKNISYLTALLIMAGLGLGLTFLVIGPDLSKVFVGHLSIADLSFGESTQGRLMAYERALDAWQQSPWIGIGIGNYGAYTTGYNLADPGYKNIVNNQYLELLAENGVVGLAAFLLLIGYIFWRSAVAWKVCQNPEIKNYLKALTFALAAILFQYNFFSTLSILHIWVAMGLVVAVQNIALQNATSYKGSDPFTG